MSRRNQTAIAIALALTLVIGAVFAHRRTLLLAAFALIEEVPGLAEPGEESPETRWFDDYFTLEWIDPDTIAIGEPRYYQGNYSYLILGADRALLYDSGTGARDITPVIEHLTRLPVTVTPSHLHYDHVGNLSLFESVALIELPALRARTLEGKLQLEDPEHLGYLEGIPAPELHITEWWAPNSEIDLGGRKLQVIHAPGHTPDSMILRDLSRPLVFTGDYVYPGDLFAFLPGSDLASYLETAETLLGRIDSSSRLLAAHRVEPPGAPTLAYRDLVALRDTLVRIRDSKASGSGYPRAYPVNERLVLLTDFAWTQSW